ncbi:TPA: hypothetical protein U5D50_004272 [Yersinia enterocolitica]|nr:hypothetical protein [Yersinia enterocolitica]
MKILMILVSLSIIVLTGCQSSPPKATGWKDLGDVKEVPVNQNLPQLMSKINNKNVWSN